MALLARRVQVCWKGCEEAQLEQNRHRPGEPVAWRLPEISDEEHVGPPSSLALVEHTVVEAHVVVIDVLAPDETNEKYRRCQARPDAKYALRENRKVFTSKCGKKSFVGIGEDRLEIGVAFWGGLDGAV